MGQKLRGSSNFKNKKNLLLLTNGKMFGYNRKLEKRESQVGKTLKRREKARLSHRSVGQSNANCLLKTCYFTFHAHF